MTRAPNLMMLIALFSIFAIDTTVGQVRAVPMRMATGVPVRPQDAAVKNAAQPAVPNGQPASPANVAASKSPSKNAELVQAILATNFSRTTPEILQAWSTDRATVKKTTDRKPTKIVGPVLNQFEDLLVIGLSEQPEFKPHSKVMISIPENKKGNAPQSNSVPNDQGAKPEKNADKQETDKQDVGDDPTSAEKVDDKDVDEKKAKPKSEVQETGKTGDEQSKADDSGSKKIVATVLSVDAKKLTLKIANVELAKKIAKGIQLTVDAVPEDGKSNTVAKEKTTAEKVADLKRSIMLAKWSALKTFLATLEKPESQQVYSHIIKSLGTAPTAAPPANVPPEVAAQLAAQQAQAAANGIQPPDSFLMPNDIAALIEACPGNLSDPDIGSLAILINKSRGLGHSYITFVSQLESGLGTVGGKPADQRLNAASLLMKGGLTDQVENFLPSLDDPETLENSKALSVWSQLSIALYQRDKIAKWLNTAWTVNQKLVDLEKAKQPEKDLAMQNLIELSPQVDKELGEKWLIESFTASPKRGMLILSQLGTKSAEMVQQANTSSPTQRLKLLRLQNNAVESLIDVSPEIADEWNQALTLLAQNWLKEAQIAVQYSQQNSRQPYMRIDMYGNYYWMDPNEMNRMRGINRQAQPVKIGDLLEIRPSGDWESRVDRSLHLQLHKSYADLHLRINEEDQAFPFIEKIAPSHPKVARELIHEFLQIWTRNHDPNTDKRRRNPYIYFYGFDQKADAIPLTRSKQERNLRELGGWVKRIRSMPINDVDENLLANAFTTCHSSAEVFDLGRVKTVFGELGALKPETIAAISQKMRTNLAGRWRDVKTQEAKQTRRREPEVQQEVMRGYKVAQSLIFEAMKTHEDNWQLHLALACLLYDENAYSQKIQKSSEFSDRRDAAFEQFQVASEKYQAVVESLDANKQSTEVYDFWFYAALGACDLGKIDNETVPDLRQYKRVRQAIEKLPGSLASTHMTKFANNLFTRMSPIKPEIKFRYLRGGFEIVGDHPRAWEARNLFDYYRDLVNEIKLAVEVDGTDIVGHTRPFGVYVTLKHTTEIEREAGGFGKYVQNQNAGVYAFNYGRPTEDYRDKFQQSVNQALSEHFEVLNVTFEGPKTMHSRPAAQPGWRDTPYAYILLKSRGPEVDRIPPIKLDLDFLDTSGYVVIPIESPAVVIDSIPKKGDDRPATDLQMTQTLDERRADEGKLIVEISASAKGLVPELDSIIDLEKENFEIIDVDDQGVLPTSFDSKSDEIQIVSDRSWTVEYRAIEGSDSANTFAFSESKRDDVTVKRQRYKDADLVEAPATVTLERNYVRSSWMFLVWLLPLIAIGLAALAAAVVYVNRKPAETKRDFEMPKDVNAFTVLALLKSIQERNGISGSQLEELKGSINRIEESYFSESDRERTDDLEKIAETWVSRVN